MVLKAGDELESFCKSTSQKLWAGAGRNNTDNGELVGYVNAEIYIDSDNNDELTLKVEYEISDPWEAIEYHLWVGMEIKGPNGIPRNAAPGRFPFTGEVNFIVLSDLGIDANHQIYIAAHAVVANMEAGDADYDALELPSMVDFNNVNLNSPNSFLEITITSEGVLNGPKDTWCIDPTLLVFPNTNYVDALVFSSYFSGETTDVPYLDDLFANKSEELAKINWIINNIVTGPDDVNSNNVQIAIWQLLGFMEYQYQDGDFYDQEIVNFIKNSANNFGDFIPGCGERFAVILYLDGVQPLFITYPVPCKGVEETAWAIGQHTFIDETVAKKWGWIFRMEYKDCD